LEGGGRSRARRGSHLELSVQVTLEDVIKGREMTLEIPRRETCDDCKGEGAAPGTKRIPCRDCDGVGEVRVSQGFFTMRRACPTCRGEGQKIEKPCLACHGEGRVRKVRKIKARVPAGIDNHSRLKILGEGESGENGGPRGDLYVIVMVKKHAIFERQGQDLYCELMIPFSIAALGGECQVPTMEKDYHLEIPSGTPAGKIFKIKKHGIPVLGHESVRGDQYVRIEIEVPKKMNAQEQKFLKEFANQRDEKVQVKKKGIFERIKQSL